RSVHLPTTKSTKPLHACCATWNRPTESFAVPERQTPRPPPEWDSLELSVRRLLETHDALRRRTQTAERRVRELESALGRVSSGALDPLQLSERATVLERENRDMIDRLARANALVERIAARLNYLEAER